MDNVIVTLTKWQLVAVIGLSYFIGMGIGALAFFAGFYKAYLKAKEG
jgi:hypothetical protein